MDLLYHSLFNGLSGYVFKFYSTCSDVFIYSVMFMYSICSPVQRHIPSTSMAYFSTASSETSCSTSATNTRFSSFNSAMRVDNPDAVSSNAANLIDAKSEKTTSIAENPNKITTNSVADIFFTHSHPLCYAKFRAARAGISIYFILARQYGLAADTFEGLFEAASTYWSLSWAGAAVFSGCYT